MPTIIAQQQHVHNYSPHVHTQLLTQLTQSPFVFIPQNERRVLSVMDSQSWSYNMRAASTTVIQAAWRLRLARRKHQGHSEEARHDEHSERAKPTIGDGIRAVKALRYRWTTSNHTHAQLRMYRLIERAQHLRCRPPHYDFKLTAIQNRGANANANANAKCAFFLFSVPSPFLLSSLPTMQSLS